MLEEKNYDKFDRIVKSAGAAKNPQTKIKLLKVAAQQRPKVAEETVDEGMGLAVARAIDKTKPPIGRPSKRRRVSDALKMREVDKETAKNKTRKFSGKAAVKEETLDEALPVVVAGGIAAAKTAAKQAIKKGAENMAKRAVKSAVKKKVKSVISSVTSKPKNPVGVTTTGNVAVSQRPGTTTYRRPEPEQDKEDPKKKKSEVGKKVKGALKKGHSAVKGTGQRVSSLFEPKENYEQDGELLTFSDFREIVTVCNSDEESVNEGAAWTKKAGKNSEGGLNEKGRKSYEKENPGSDLKAPSKKVGNPRRASFCARMKGMKKKLTSKKTASDPDSRINKSLRAWNC